MRDCTGPCAQPGAGHGFESGAIASTVRNTGLRTTFKADSDLRPWCPVETPGTDLHPRDCISIMATQALTNVLKPPVDRVRSAARPLTARQPLPESQAHAAPPALLTPDDLSRWERKGRGVAVFGCPDTFSLPEIESRPGTTVLCDPDEGQEIPGEPDRLVLKLSSRRVTHLNSLINLVVLPAYRRHFPLYLFVSWDLQNLDAGSVEMPDKDGIEEAMEPLLGEQLRSVLACTCAVFPSPGAVGSSEKPWLTPVERMMHGDSPGPACLTNFMLKLDRVSSTRLSRSHGVTSWPSRPTAGSSSGKTSSRGRDADSRT